MLLVGGGKQKAFLGPWVVIIFSGFLTNIRLIILNQASYIVRFIRSFRTKFVKQIFSLYTLFYTKLFSSEGYAVRLTTYPLNMSDSQRTR